MRRLLPALAALFAGCQGYSEPTPGVLARVRWMDPLKGPALRLTVEIDIEGSKLAGRFDGVIVARTGPSPVLRAQCFPDLGPKAIDLVARRDRIRGILGPEGERVDAAMPLVGMPHPLLLMGLSLLEHVAPVTEDRVLGVRDEGDLTWLSLRPVVEGSHSAAALDGMNRVVRRSYSWVYGIRWEEDLDPGRNLTIRAPNFIMRVRIRESQVLAAVPDSTFEFQR